MEHGAGLNELMDSGVAAAGGLAVTPEQFPLFETAMTDVSARTKPSADLMGVRASSLIEEAWTSADNTEHCNQFLEHRLMAQEYEGLRMGRELHDSTGQLLLSLRLSIAHLREVREGGAPDSIFDEITETVRQIDQEIRAFSFLHYPAELGKGGLVAALDMLARGFGERTHLKIVFKSTGTLAAANAASSMALLRVAQEALMNVHRHAKAGLVRMSLIEHKDRLELTVRDDGQGIKPPEGRAVANGVGLHGMRHRVERLGGRFSIRRLKQGTGIVASVPIRR